MPTNNFLISQGTGTTIATEQGVSGEHYQKIKLIDPTVMATTGIGIASNPLKVDPTGTTTQPVSIASMPSTPVTGTFFQATQPVSAASLPLPSGAATAAKQPALGVAGTASTDVISVQGITSMTALKVDGSGVTQPVSLSSLPSLAAGTNVIGHVIVDSEPITGVTQSGTWTVQPGNTANTTPWLFNLVGGGNTALVDSTGDLQVDVMNPVQVAASSLCVSATAATGVAVTATLPAVAANFHYISLIEIHKYFTVANAASATPLVVTTTNLPGSLAFTFGQPLGAIGVTDERVYSPNSPLKSSVLNTATTIVCPAATGIIWRVNVFYFSAP